MDGDVGVGVEPVEKGEPATSIRLPPDPTENTEILFDPWLATNTKCPAGSMANATGVVPVAGLPLTAARVPFAFTE